jgi:hypothetical protein
MLINCTITANSITHAVAGAISGGGAHLEGSSLVYNCIVWGNAGGANSQLADASPSGFGPITVSHSIVQGGFPGTGVLDQDPLFANSTAGAFRPVPGAPGLDIGAPESLAGLADRDLDDKPRSIPALAGFPPLPDLGAYEFGDYAEVLNIVIGPNRKARLDIRSSLSDGLRIEATTNLLDWIDLGPPDPNGAQLIFRDQEAPTIGRRFYRFESP